MKKLLTAALAIFCTALASGQPGVSGIGNASLSEDLQENIFRTGVNTNPYEYIPTAETPVPKGFKPFYISHYGRHGSRSDWESGYAGVRDAFEAASKAGLLTPDADTALARINRIIELHDGMDGRLTRRGTLEHRQIAGRMYDKYGKTVFGDRKRARVRAISSMTQRCIISMASFTTELQRRNPRLDFWWDTGETIQPLVSSSSSSEVKKAANKIIAEYRKTHLPDTVAFARRMFTDPDAARAVTGNTVRLMDAFQNMARICGAWDMDDFMLRCLTESDRCMYNVRQCMVMYLRQCNSIEFGDSRMKDTEALLDDVIEKADEAIAGGDCCADLRFGHDYHLLAFSSRVGIRGIGERLDAQACQSWRGHFYTPFAGNLQMVFYRNKAGEVLVKFYINEREATTLLLPGGPYYRWEDFKKAVRYRPVMGEVEATVQTGVKEISGLCAHPSGKGWLAASDEDGLWSVSPDGESTPFWTMKADWLDCEGVTMDPDTKDVYYVVEGRQELCRLAAPSYDKPQTLLTLKDTAFDTNHGFEGVTWFKDGTLLVGNQYQPIQLIHYSPRDGILSRKELKNTSEIAGLCYDPVTGFLWIADSFKFKLHLCNTDGEVLLSYPIPFIANGESLCVDHAGSCIWVGDDETSKIYKIHFDKL